VFGMADKRIPRSRDPLSSGDRALKLGTPDFSKLRCERPLLDPTESRRIKEDAEAAAWSRSAPNLGGSE